jgi:hypothetical protein
MGEAPAWAAAPAVVAALGESGRALYEGLMGRFEFSSLEGERLLEACRAADVLAQLRQDPEADLRQVRLWSAHFTSLLGGFGVTS